MLRCKSSTPAAAGATFANQVIARMYMLCRRESGTSLSHPGNAIQEDRVVDSDNLALIIN